MQFASSDSLPAFPRASLHLVVVSPSAPTFRLQPTSPTAASDITESTEIHVTGDDSQKLQDDGEGQPIFCCHVKIVSRGVPLSKNRELKVGEVCIPPPARDPTLAEGICISRTGIRHDHCADAGFGVQLQREDV